MTMTTAAASRRRTLTTSLEMMDRNHLGWQVPLSGLVAGAGHDDTQVELEDSFCRTRPDIAAHFAAVTFRGDNRSNLDR